MAFINTTKIFQKGNPQTLHWDSNMTEINKRTDNQRFVAYAGAKVPTGSFGYYSAYDPPKTGIAKAWDDIESAFRKAKTDLDKVPKEIKDKANEIGSKIKSAGSDFGEGFQRGIQAGGEINDNSNSDGPLGGVMPYVLIAGAAIAVVLFMF